MATEKGFIAVVFICLVASIIGFIVKLGFEQGLIASVLLGLAYLIGFIWFLLMRKYDPPSEAKQVKGNAGEEQTRSKRSGGTYPKALHLRQLLLLIGFNVVIHILSALMLVKIFEVPVWLGVILPFGFTIEWYFLGVYSHQRKKIAHKINLPMLLFTLGLKVVVHIFGALLFVGLGFPFWLGFIMPFGFNIEQYIRNRRNRNAED